MSDGKLTQQQIADHLCMSVRNVRDVLKQLDLAADYTLDDVRSAYIVHLRSVASGHRSNDGQDLIAARVRNENISADLKELDLRKRRGELIDADEFYQLFAPATNQIKAGLLNLANSFARKISKDYGVEVDANIFSDPIESALDELSRYDDRERYDEQVASAITTT